MAQARRKRPRKETRAAQPLDAIRLLTNDHAAVQRLFREFEKLHEKEEDTGRVIDAARNALLIHDAIEEAIFYRAVRERAGETEEELLDEAEVEHKTMRQLLKDLRPGKLDEKKREAHFTVLVEYVRHHVKEEEKEMFPKVKRLKRVDLEAIGTQMEQRKVAMMKKMGLALD